MGSAELAPGALLVSVLGLFEVGERGRGAGARGVSKAEGLWGPGWAPPSLTCQAVKCWAGSLPFSFHYKLNFHFFAHFFHCFSESLGGVHSKSRNKPIPA